MDENQRFDVFLAYYGNSRNGSENYARGLYGQINGANINERKKVCAYFHPITNPHGAFDDTPVIVARTPLFLLAIDKNVPRSDAGQLSSQRSDGTLRNLFEEVQAFHRSIMYRSKGGENASKLYIADNFSFLAAEQLHPIFAGKVAYTSASEVLDWIKDFYNRIYIDRIYMQCRDLAATNRTEFMNGDWVKEAEYVFGYSHSENIGRSLLIFCKMRYENGDAAALERMRFIYGIMKRMRIAEASTRAVLDGVEKILYP